MSLVVENMNRKVYKLVIPKFTIVKLKRCKNMNTMIKLKLETREVLNTLKVVDRESYDDVIKD